MQEESKYRTIHIEIKSIERGIPYTEKNPGSIPTSSFLSPYRFISCFRPVPTEYTECQAFCPVVRIGSPSLTRKQVVLPPFGSKRGDTLACEYCPPLFRSKGGDTLACGGGGGGTQFPTKGQKLVLYLYFNPSLRPYPLALEKHVTIVGVGTYNSFPSVARWPWTISERIVPEFPSSFLFPMIRS